MIERSSIAAGLVVGLALGAGLVLWVGRPGAEVTETTHQHTDHAQAHHHTEEIWTCSMHPQVQQAGPGACPLCGMDLIPQSQEQGDESSVRLSARAQALARIRTTEVVRRRPDSGAMVLQGLLAEDEGRLKAVTAWAGGRIHRLDVKTTGETIKRGQRIARLYSPEIFTASKDLQVAVAQVKRLENAPESVRQGAKATVEAVRTKLSLLGVSDRSIDAIARRQRPDRYVTIRSPFAGTVLERLVAEGDSVEPGAPLYRVADLGGVWALLDAYEDDLQRLSVGQQVSIALPGAPESTFEGRITFIEPTVDRRLRTAQVRVQLDNPKGVLRPGMRIEGTITPTDMGPPPLVIPDTAPLLTGRRAIVYVETDDGDRHRYTPRTVRLGARVGGVYPVLSGLREGERVVTRGAFTLDADLQIKGGPGMMSGPDDEGPAPVRLVKITKAQRQRLAPLARHYLEISRALAADELSEAKSASEAFLQSLPGMDAFDGGGLAAHWSERRSALQQGAWGISEAASLEDGRVPFEGLSLAFTALLSEVGNPLDAPIRVAYCPMAFDNRGARWVQSGDTVDNAYFGAKMRRCGTIEASLGPGDYLADQRP
ncbi:MAG: efflux RND transporter periplasmic adaptor subunit [Bradymonadia bacterium]